MKPVYPVLERIHFVYPSLLKLKLKTCMRYFFLIIQLLC
jgi:hypothetical protein